MFSALVMTLEEECVSCQAPRSPNDETRELRRRKHFNKQGKTPSILFSADKKHLCQSRNRRSRRVKLDPEKFWRFESFGSSSVSDQSHLCSSVRAKAAREQETGRRGRRCVALGRNRALGRRQRCQDHKPPPPLLTPLSRLLPSSLSSLSHCKV